MTPKYVQKKWREESVSMEGCGLDLFFPSPFSPPPPKTHKGQTPKECHILALIQREREREREREKTRPFFFLSLLKPLDVSFRFPFGFLSVRYPLPFPTLPLHPHPTQGTSHPPPPPPLTILRNDHHPLLENRTGTSVRLPKIGTKLTLVLTYIACVYRWNSFFLSFSFVKKNIYRLDSLYA